MTLVKQRQLYILLNGKTGARGVHPRCRLRVRVPVRDVRYIFDIQRVPKKLGEADSKDL